MRRSRSCSTISPNTACSRPNRSRSRTSRSIPAKWAASNRSTPRCSPTRSLRPTFLPTPRRKSATRCNGELGARRLAHTEHDDGEQHEADRDDEGADDAEGIEERVAPFGADNADRFDDDADERDEIMEPREAGRGGGDRAIIEPIDHE